MYTILLILGAILLLAGIIFTAFDDIITISLVIISLGVIDLIFLAMYSMVTGIGGAL